MADIFNATLAAQLETAPGEAFLVLTLTLPNGTKKWSTAAIPSHSGGQIYPKLFTMSRITRSVLDRKNSLERFDVTASIDDSDGTFAALAEGADGNDIKGSAAVITLGHRRVDASSWDPLKTGVIRKAPQAALMTYDLVISEDDEALLAPHLPILTRSVWPNAGEGVIGRCAIVIYGRHSSVAQDENGMVELLCVDALEHRYGPILGRIAGSVTVFVDGAERASGWAVITPILGGYQWTLIEFDSDPSTDGKPAVVTIDCEGIEDVGDGSGDLIEEPAAQLEHALINLVFGAYRQGDWATSHARVDATSFAALSTFFAGIGAKTGHVLGPGEAQSAGSTDPRPTGLDIIHAFTESLEFKALFTTTGKVGVGVHTPYTTDLTSAPLLSAPVHDIGGQFSRPQEDDSRTSAITMSFSDGRQILPVTDPAVDEVGAITEQLQQPVSARFVVE